jgi:hypothetical protein
MAENLWLRCNAWPAEEASTRQGMPTRALPKDGARRIWVSADRRSDRAIPEEAKLPRSNTGDRASDIYRGAVLPVKR